MELAATRYLEGQQISGWFRKVFNKFMSLIKNDGFRGCSPWFRLSPSCLMLEARKGLAVQGSTFACLILSLCISK